MISAYKALSYPNGLSLCISTGSRAASELIKKVHLMAESVKKMTNGAIDYIPSADACKFSNGSRVISLPSGNPIALRGWSAQCVLIDECAFIESPQDVWQSIVPTLTRDQNAELVVASTPAAKSGLFWDLYSGADDSWYVQTTTLEDAVRDGLKVDIEQIRAMYQDKEVFDQEYMCKFASEYSSMIDISILEFYDECPATNTTYLGFDVGSVGDRSALVTLREASGVLYVDDIVVMHKASYESQMDAVKQLHDRNHYTSGYIDAVGIGSALSEFVSKQVSTKIKGFTWTSASKTPAYEAMRARIFDHKLKFNRKFKNLIQEDFQNVNRIVTETGKVMYEAGRDKNGHSDVTSAIVLAVQASRDNPANMSTPMSFAMPSAFGGRHRIF